MRQKIKKISECFFTIILLVIVLVLCTRIFARKNSNQKLGTFFENASDFDVLFLGNSHMINGVMPMELWDDYGITSFNLAGHDSKMATDYWVLINALDYSKPKVVVIDCGGLSSNLKASDNYEYTHLLFDAFPLSYNKIMAAIDITDDKERAKEERKITIENVGEKRLPIGLIWNYSVYHSRWKELTRDDFVQSYSKEMGAESRIQISYPGDIISVDKDSVLSSTTVSEQYLEKIVLECKARGIAVVLTYLPFPASYDEWIEANTTYRIAEKYDVRYVNFLSLDVVDYDTDCYDSFAHLNPSGAKKVTKYLGEILLTEYGLENHKGNHDFEKWDEMYSEYFEYKNSKLKEQKGLDQYLMLLNDNDYKVSISIGDYKIHNDPYFDELLNACNVDYNDQPSIVKGQINVVVRDVKNDEIIEKACFCIKEKDDNFNSNQSNAVKSVAVRVDNDYE